MKIKTLIENFSFEIFKYFHAKDSIDKSVVASFFCEKPACRVVQFVCHNNKNKGQKVNRC